MHVFLSFNKITGQLLFGIEGVAIIHHHLFTRPCSFRQTFITLYTVFGLTRQLLLLQNLQI